jgi:DNA-binding response OmpR family regulator
MTKKILLIDDDFFFVDLMREVLEMEGYAFTGIGYEDDPVEQVRKVQPDLVLLDYCLPANNEGELCFLLHNADEMKKLPIVLLSAFPTAWVPLDRLPCTAFIPKPFDLPELLACITQALLCTRETEKPDLFS